MINQKVPKCLEKPDVSGWLFSKRIFGNDRIAGVNLDIISPTYSDITIYKHPTKGRFFFELLKCDASQIVTPWTSHPNKYWNLPGRKNKFVALWNMIQDFKKDVNANLILINYADKDTEHEDKIGIIHVYTMDNNGIKDPLVADQWSFQEFKTWMRNLNAECSRSLPTIQQ